MSDERDLLLMQRDIDDLRKRAENAEGKIDQLEAQDRNRMRAAVVALGMLVTGLITYIWTTTVGGK